MSLPPFANSHSTSRNAWSPSSPASEDTEVTLPTASEVREEDLLVSELEKHDDIRFVSYRTAAKLRTLQKQTYLHHIDIWNMIEAFRENGLHGLDPSAKVTESKVQKLIHSLYDNLQKRLPPQPQPLTTASGSNAANSSSSSSSLLPNSNQPHAILLTKANLLQTFLWRALRPSADKIKIRTLKAALATLCTGKLMDKLRYLFSQLADAEGILVHNRFQNFLKDVMKIPLALAEYTTFEVEENLFFKSEQRVMLNDFLETMMSDPGPPCLAWLLVLHRLINSETVFHPVPCGNCHINGFNGLRYKSDRSNYHLCQNCFWRGKISHGHAEDVFKEFNTFKSHSGKSSFKRSLHCIPSEKRSSSGCKPHVGGNYYPEQNEKPMDLSNMIPPVLGHARSRKQAQAVASSENDLQQFYPYNTSSDEHSLIAQYANQLAAVHPEGSGTRRESAASPGRSALNHSRQIVQDLEKRNREIMRDISQLRRYRDLDLQRYDCDNPELVSELNHLRNHKDELDDRLSELQNTRKELMTELEELMKLLQTQKLSHSPNAMFEGGAGSLRHYDHTHYS